MTTSVLGHTPTPTRPPVERTCSYKARDTHSDPIKPVPASPSLRNPLDLTEEEFNKYEIQHLLFKITVD